MKSLLLATAALAALAAGISHAQTNTGAITVPDATSPRPTSPGVTSPGVTMPTPEINSNSNMAGTGTPSISSLTANTMTGTATGDDPPGSSGQIAPGVQNTGSTTGQAGGQ